MRSNTLLLGVLLLVNGVFDVEADEVLSVSVMEGDSVTLHTDVTEVPKDSNIIWKFGDKIIAKMIEADATTLTYNDMIFKDRLNLDRQTGSLTITNIRPEHIGRYSVDIKSTDAKLKTFQVTVHGVFIAETNVSVMEGDSVTLKTDDKQRYDKIEWRFGEERIAGIKEVNGTYYDEVWRFRGRLQLNHTGSLTIRNTTTEHTGQFITQFIV
ncbi:uncharacterized protein LOC127986837 isoform X1 [Carassius gibelio]|uniref:uncharacterized protein LOC127986837 isoform X1 n=1 Tax=Carassius gibelio TaxID=101364 RepID=UPI00227932B0|nr:uncharacterized protein LOC127986837 isoform X1 [Carassius gibelio]